MTPRAVFDCMVLLQAVGSDRGPAAACLGLAEMGIVELVTSDATAAELRDVLDRPSTRRRLKSVTDARVARFLARVAGIAVRIDPVSTAFAFTRDPDDSKYLDLAIAAAANYLVTRDNDLLDLMTAPDAEATAFRTTYPDIAILDPVAFLQAVRPPVPPPPVP